MVPIMGLYGIGYWYQVTHVTLALQGVCFEVSAADRYITLKNISDEVLVHLYAIHFTPQYRDHYVAKGMTGSLKYIQHEH